MAVPKLIQNAASVQVYKAIKRGDLVRQPCEVCGFPQAQAHHDDYSKPLDVRWLCPKHHNMHHWPDRASTRASTACPNGHVRSEVGFYTFPDGRKNCRACKTEASRRWNAKRKQKGISI